MNRTIKLEIDGGGVFSKYMLGIASATRANFEFQSLYFNVVDPRFLVNGVNPFNYVLKQQFDKNSVKRVADRLITYHSLNPIEMSYDFKLYKGIISKIQFTDELNSLLEDSIKRLNISKDTLGVHVRLTDMNTTHGSQYGIGTTKQYIETIRGLTPKHNIFVASDNNESLIKLKKEFGNKIASIDDCIRADAEDSYAISLWLDGNNFKQLWIEAFLDMLLLSKCGTIVCRTSNLSNTSILYADDDVNVIRLPPYRPAPLNLQRRMASVREIPIDCSNLTSEFCEKIGIKKEE